MRCRDVAALDSAYIDGELDEARASAVRGHLRVCEACRERVADLATLVHAAARLEPIEPGPSLWAGIERGLAEAEIADAQRSWLWLRWHALRPRLLPVAVTVAAAAALLLWAARRHHEPGPARTPVTGPMTGIETAAGQAEPDHEPGGPTGAATGPAETFFAAMDRDIAEADQRYLDAIEELRAIIDEERGDWPGDVRAAYDARVAAFDMAARGHREVLAHNPAGDARARDALYAIYQAEIEFLQQAALQGPELIAAADIGTRDTAPGAGGAP